MNTLGLRKTVKKARNVYTLLHCGATNQLVKAPVKKMLLLRALKHSGGDQSAELDLNVITDEATDSVYITTHTHVTLEQLQ